MFYKLNKRLKKEEQLLKELLFVLQGQQKSYAGTDAAELNSLNRDKETVLNQSEELRIRLIMTWLNIPRKEAVEMRLSSIDKTIKIEEITGYGKVKSNYEELCSLLGELL